MTLDTPFTRWLVRWRWVFLILLGVLIVLPFNGQWRIGLDSALYRGVAENLVHGKGYTFAGLPQRQIYPGLPFLLAGFHKLTGDNSIVPVLVLMNLCAFGVILGVYALVQERFATWIAVVVTCGVGLNVRFIQQAHEIMTDMPFLLGVVLAMLGWEWLGHANSRKRRWAYVLMGAGLFLAAVMRPTFWVLAVALGITCVWNILRHRHKQSLIGLGVLLGVGLLFAVVDPRVVGLNLLRGGYEREFLSLAGQFRERVQMNAPKLLSQELPESFFAETLTYFALPAAGLILCGCLMVWWRKPLWGMQVFILLVVMLVLSDAPRYLLMVLPTMWLGYVLVLLWLTQYFRPKYRDWTLFAMFSLANFLNLGGYARLLYEQHSGNFLDTYRDGSFRKLIKMSELVREKVPEDAVVVGPHANILTYFSGRQVRSGRIMGLEWGAVSRYPKLVARHNPTYLIGPVTELATKDKPVARLVSKGVIRPITFIGKIDDPKGTLWLTTCEVVIPETPWTQLPDDRPVVYAPRPPRKPPLTPEEIAHRELKAKRERKELRARRERKAIRAAREAARQSPPQPSTAPATQPVSEWSVPLDRLGVLWINDTILS